jgi:hypothetical protein
MKNLVLIICLLCSSLSLSAQSYYFNSSDHLWWVNLGAGINQLGNTNQQFMLYGSINKPRTDRLLLTGRFTYAREMEEPEFTGPENNWDISGLASLYLKGDAGYFSIGAGLGVNGGKIRAGRLEQYLTVGLPIETQLFATLPSLGIGLVGTANINPKTTYWGVGLALQFGTLR